MSVEIVEREAGRVFVIDERDRVLLFRGCDPAVPDEKYWFSVGGGVDPGEDARTAACRELREETGLLADAGDLGEPVYEERVEFGFGGRLFRQHHTFYAYRVRDAVINTSGFEALEVETMDRYHWWSLAELTATDEVYYPAALVGVLRKVL